MKRFLNPFEYLSNEKAFGWGFAGALLSLGLVFVMLWQVGYNTSVMIGIFSTNLLLWLPLSTLLYLAALVFSPSRIRAVDIFATNLFALLPTIVLVAILNTVNYGFASSVVAVPGSLTHLAIRAVYSLSVIILSVSMVWSMVWGCFAFNVSANMKGLRGIIIFVTCYVFVSVMLQLLFETFCRF